MGYISTPREGLGFGFRFPSGAFRKASEKLFIAPKPPPPPPPSEALVSRVAFNRIFKRPIFVSKPRAVAKPMRLSPRTLPATMPAAPAPPGVMPPAPQFAVRTPVPTPQHVADAIQDEEVKQAGLNLAQMLVIGGVALFVLPGLFKANRKGRR